jgi:hypothetical protein
MKLIYIGEKFYDESKTMMSSIYHEQDEDGVYLRSDWGKVNVALRNGENVEIRQATDAEFGFFQRELDKARRSP